MVGGWVVFVGVVGSSLPTSVRASSRVFPVVLVHLILAIMANNTLILRSYVTQAIIESIDGPDTPSAQCLFAQQGKIKGNNSLMCCTRSRLPELEYQFHENTLFEAIYGIYNLIGGTYIALLVESEAWVNVTGMKIRRAKKIVIQPLFQANVNLSESQQIDDDIYLRLLRQAFSEHTFFYSKDFDLSHSQQRLAKMKLNKSLNISAPWKSADPRFFWNLDVVSELVSCGANDWIIPFVSGYVEIRPDCVIDEHTFTLLLISRRSRYNQGCRFFRRGINSDGNVANFVETEQLLLFPDGRLTSYVQTRGSIPIIWQSFPMMKYAPEVKIDPSTQKSVEFATLHTRNLLDCYSNNLGRSGVLFVNLIDQKKEQGMLGEAFKRCINDVKAATTRNIYAIDYIWFDFHAETAKPGKWNNLCKLLVLSEKIFNSQGYFTMNANGLVTSWQEGCIRTNCMDNLDRTNVVQSLFARQSILHQLQLQKLPMPVSLSVPGAPSITASGDERTLQASAAAKYIEKNQAAVSNSNSTNNNDGSSSSSKSTLDSAYPAFETIFKKVWVNHADSISRSYAGTGALKVDFTLTGNRTIKGLFSDGFNSCKRYYINNFTDGIKQDSIDLLLGNYVPNSHMSSPFMHDPQQHDDLTSALLKWFFFVMSIFSLRTFVFSALDTSTSLADLVIFMRQSLIVAHVFLLYLTFIIVKKGSLVGERLVVKNRLFPGVDQNFR